MAKAKRDKEAEEKINLQLMKAIKAVHSMISRNDIEKQRQSQNNLATLFSTKDVEYEDFEIEGIEAEWVRSSQRHLDNYIILYCHGGGYFTGSIKYARSVTSKLALVTSMNVLSFDYSLAPEEPFPNALNDAVKVYDYLLHHGYGSKNIIIAGDSAGGNLALVLTLKLKEEGRILPRGLVLFSPWTDLTFSGRSHQNKAEVDPVLSKEYMDSAREAYMPEACAEDLMNPLVSPLFGDFTGFPPTYIQVGENEILLNDATDLQKKMMKQNVFAQIDIYKGMWHVFQMSPFKTANEAMDKVSDFIFKICGY